MNTSEMMTEFDIDAEIAEMQQRASVEQDFCRKNRDAVKAGSDKIGCFRCYKNLALHEPVSWESCKTARINRLNFNHVVDAVSHRRCPTEFVIEFFCERCGRKSNAGKPVESLNEMVFDFEELDAWDLPASIKAGKLVKKLEVKK